MAGLQFYVTPKQRLSPAPVLLAFFIATAILLAALHVQNRAHPGAASGADDDDDPSRVDTIYLGDPSEAPVAKRPGGKPSTVHPFRVIHLPRSGSQFGQIPDTEAGRLLYSWLAAFNGPDPSAVGKVLPTPEADLVQAAQLQLRRQTGGFTLISAREVQPGLLVFRLHDQTPAFNEVLGSLQVQPGTLAPGIASLSLRAVPQPQPRQP